MTRCHRSLCTLLVALVTLAFAAPRADAFVSLKRGGGETTWRSANVTYYLKSSGSADVTMSQLEAAVGAAFQSWEDVACSQVNFTYGGQRSYDPEDGIYISFQESNWDPTVGDAAAYSMSSTNWSGDIVSNVIVFNGERLTWTTSASEANSGLKSDIQGVLAHELGHSIGLDHTRVLEATMFFASTGNTEMRTLHDDDKRGACYLYPSGSWTGGQACDSCTSDSHCGPSGLCLDFGGTAAYFCGSSCSSNADCADDFYCYTTNGINQCVPDTLACDDSGNNVGMGGYCYGYEVCESGLVCLPAGGDAYCTRQCPTGSCPDGYQCWSNYCIRGGAGEFGDSCSNAIDCRSMHCVTVRPGDYMCSVECDDDGDCPDGAGCAYGSCFPAGDTPFGEACSAHIDCETSFCGGSYSDRFCSVPCDGSDAPCPPGSRCSSAGYCRRAVPQTGDACTSVADCPTGDLCKRSYENAAQGVCVRECNPFTDTGCEDGQSCRWLEQTWVTGITGECADRNWGHDLGELCLPTGSPCEHDLVCTRRSAGEDYHCWQDCRTDTGSGCAAPDTCVSLERAHEPTHGGCVAPDRSCASDADCGSGTFCRLTAQGANDGQCVPECNPFADIGCPDGQVCHWFEMPWLGAVKGECVAKTWGHGLGDVCYPGGSPCEEDLVCTRPAGTTNYRCYGDCRTDTAFGCTSMETCVPLGIEEEPLHGVCFLPGATEPDPDPVDAGSVPQPDTWEPPVEDTYEPPAEDTYQPPQPDTYRPPAPDTYQPPQPDTGTTPQPGVDTRPATPDTAGTTGGLEGGGSSGGCTAGAGAPAGAPFALLLLLLGLTVLRRR